MYPSPDSWLSLATMTVGAPGRIRHLAHSQTQLPAASGIRHLADAPAALRADDVTNGDDN